MSDDRNTLVDPYWQYGPGTPFSTPGRDSYNSVRRPGDVGNATPGFLGFRILDVINDLAKKQDTYESVGRYVGEQKTLAQIRTQLAPGQEVTVVMNYREGKVSISKIERPGEGYLFDPTNSSVYLLKGDDSGICPISSQKSEETTHFLIKNSATGKSEKIDLDTHVNREHGDSNKIDKPNDGNDSDTNDHLN